MPKRDDVAALYRQHYDDLLRRACILLHDEEDARDAVSATPARSTKEQVPATKRKPDCNVRLRSVLYNLIFPLATTLFTHLPEYLRLSPCRGYSLYTSLRK